MSTIERTEPTATRSRLSRRHMLKAGGAAVGGLALAGPKPSKAFAAPAFLQGEPITLATAPGSGTSRAGPKPGAT